MLVYVQLKYDESILKIPKCDLYVDMVNNILNITEQMLIRGCKKQ